MKTMKNTVAMTLVLALGVGCGGNTNNQEILKQESKVSECGGFASKTDALTREVADYCDAERLNWTYDAAAQKLELTDARVTLNCCGDHEISIEELEDGSFLVTEVDMPLEGGGRCNCMCVFDFSVAAEGIPEGTIALKIVRQVSDEGNESDVWAGELDLTAGSGSVVIDDSDAYPWCEQL